MRLIFDKVKIYRLPLKKSLSVRPGQSIAARELAIVGFKKSDGKLFFGELSPLLGLHSESLVEAIDQLKSVINRIAPSGDFNIDFMQTAPSWTKPFFGYFDFEGVYPSVLCAIEQVLWSAYHDSVKTKFATTVDISGFISDPLAKDLDVEALRACRSVKIKIGRYDIYKEVAAIEAIRPMLAPGASIRLDPNQSLSLEDFDTLAKAKDSIGIDYLEEPFEDSSIYSKLSGTLNIALDESTYDRPPGNLDQNLMLSLKPGRLGFSTVMAWAEHLSNINQQLVLSSSYESGIGTSYLIQLAGVLGVQKPLGIGTYMQLQDDLLDPALPLRFGPCQINHDGLVPVAWSES